MSRYMLSLFRRGQLEVLSRRTISGDRSTVYLLGTTHRTAESRRNARKLVDIIRPDIVFLELDPERARRLDTFPDSEFYVARCAARHLGINVVYGDHDVQETLALLARRKVELKKLYPLMSKDDIERKADDDIVLDFRDRYMVDNLLRLDHSLILGIVGNDHLVGMKRDWEKKTT